MSSEDESQPGRNVAELRVHFSDYFDIDPRVLRDYGAINVSLINDLPLFIDPFLLFESDKEEYRALHESIIKYLRFLRDKSSDEGLSSGALKAWFSFREVKETWLGFSAVGNAGSGLGSKFANSLYKNLHTFFRDFGDNSVARSSHLEKLCLIEDGVGKDYISDFVTNLIKGFLLKYTERFSVEHLRSDLRRRFRVDRSRFSYETEAWQAEYFELPCHVDRYVILTPRDLLTKDETWINRSDLYTDFDDIVRSVDNDQLRAQLNNYLGKQLTQETRDPSKGATKSERKRAIKSVIRQFPVTLDYYIKYKEDDGEGARRISEERVEEIETHFVRGVRNFIASLSSLTDFYKHRPFGEEEVKARVAILKNVVERLGGHRFFIDAYGRNFSRESDVHLLLRLVWLAEPPQSTS